MSMRATYQDSTTKLLVLHSNSRNIESNLSEANHGINAADWDGRTLMHHAAYWGKLEVLEWLLNQGADAKAKDKYGFTPLSSAARGHGRRLVAEALLDRDDSVINVPSNAGFTPLYEAVYKDKPDLVRLLCDRGADVLGRGDGGETPLYCAAEYGNVEIMKCLLANIDNDMDVRAGDEEKGTILHTAARMGHEDASCYLVENGATVDVRDKYGKTPFFHAVYCGLGRLARMLADRGANMDVIDGKGNTPIYGVSDVALARWLLINGADVNHRNKHGIAPLHEVDDEEVALLLLENGANVHATDQKGETPLHKAVEEGNREKVVGVFLANGANVDADNQKGETALHKVAETDDTDLAGVLLQNQANVNATTGKGETPLHYAAGVGSEQVMRLLLNHKHILGGLNETQIFVRLDLRNPFRYFVNTPEAAAVAKNHF